MFDEIYMDHKVKFCDGVAFFPYSLNIDDIFLLKKMAEKRNYTVSVRNNSAYGHGTFEVRVVSEDYPEILQDKEMEKVKSKLEIHKMPFLEHRTG